MRSLFIILLLVLPLALQSTSQERLNGFEFKLSLIHPVRQHENYNFTVDPAFEIFYFTPVSKMVLVSGGVMVQAGKQSWDVYTGHTVYPEEWTPYPLRGMYDRRYEYISAGIPLKTEYFFDGKFISSFYTEFTIGRYFQIDLKDYYNSKLIYSFDIGYHGLFWDFQLGLTKNFYQIKKLSMAVSALAGVRNQQLDGYINMENITKYLYLGVGLSIRLSK